MAESRLPKPVMRVRSPLPAPFIFFLMFIRTNVYINLQSSEKKQEPSEHWKKSTTLTELPEI